MHVTTVNIANIVRWKDNYIAILLASQADLDCLRNPSSLGISCFYQVVRSEGEICRILLQLHADSLLHSQSISHCHQKERSRKEIAQRTNSTFRTSTTVPLYLQLRIVS